MYLKKIFIPVVALSLFIALLYSCNTGPYSGYKKTVSDVYYKIHTGNNNDTAAVHVGSIVTMDLNYGLKDSILFDSRDNGQPVVIQISTSEYKGDIYECLQYLRQNDSATFILKAGPLFKNTFRQPELPSFLTEETDIYFNVKLFKVQSKEELDRENEIRNMQMQQQEMGKLEEYITKNNITVTPTASGIYFLETKKGTGKSPVKDGYVSVHYTVHLLDGDQLFSTHERGEPLEFKFGSQFENVGFQEVVGMMKEGGKANAIVPSAMAFGAKGAGDVVPPYSTLYYDVEVVKIISKEEFDKKQAEKEAKKQAENQVKEKEESGLIQKYLKDNNIKPTITLPNGLIYVETLAGTGTKPQNGKKVKVNYTGRLLDGTKFDSSIDRGEPYEFPLGKRAVIEGWDVGIALMNEGGKATLIIPSKLAYKDRGAGDVIPPYSPLVFDVELVSVEK